MQEYHIQGNFWSKHVYKHTFLSCFIHFFCWILFIINPFNAPPTSLSTALDGMSLAPIERGGPGVPAPWEWKGCQTEEAHNLANCEALSRTWPVTLTSAAIKIWVKQPDHPGTCAGPCSRHPAWSEIVQGVCGMKQFGDGLNLLSYCLILVI